MAKILFLIAPKMFRDEEFFVPFEAFKASGHDVTVISTQKGTASGKLGGAFKVHKTIDDVAADFYEALVIAGGPGSKEFLWPSDSVRQLIQDFSVKNKIVAAICSAAALPAIAAIAQGKKMTCFPGELEIAHLKTAQAIYTAENVTADGSLITANGPAAANEFAQKILEQLSPNS
jgi:protease I